MTAAQKLTAEASDLCDRLFEAHGAAFQAKDLDRMQRLHALHQQGRARWWRRSEVSMRETVARIRPSELND